MQGCMLQRDPKTLEVMGDKMPGEDHDYRQRSGLLDVLIEGAYVVDKHRKILY